MPTSGKASLPRALDKPCPDVGASPQSRSAEHQCRSEQEMRYYDISDKFCASYIAK